MRPLSLGDCCCHREKDLQIESEDCSGISLCLGVFIFLYLVSTSISNRDNHEDFSMFSWGLKEIKINETVTIIPTYC